jgi:hypothetical protein
MTSISLQDTEYAGTISRPATTLSVTTRCLGCGSSLAGRKLPVQATSTGRTVYMVHRWLCRCGRSRTLRQEVTGR